MNLKAIVSSLAVSFFRCHPGRDRDLFLEGGGKMFIVGERFPEMQNPGHIAADKVEKRQHVFFARTRLEQIRAILSFKFDEVKYLPNRKSDDVEE